MNERIWQRTWLSSMHVTLLLVQSCWSGVSRIFESTPDRPENLVKMEGEKALAARAGEVAQQGSHKRDTICRGGAFPELVDQEERPRGAAAHHVSNLHVLRRQGGCGDPFSTFSLRCITRKAQGFVGGNCVARLSFPPHIVPIFAAD